MQYLSEFVCIVFLLRGRADSGGLLSTSITFRSEIGSSLSAPGEESRITRRQAAELFSRQQEFVPSPVGAVGGCQDSVQAPLVLSWSGGKSSLDDDQRRLSRT